jgi:hypothetical protein
MRDNAEYQWMIDGNEPVDRVVHNLSFAVSHSDVLKTIGAKLQIWM